MCGQGEASEARDGPQTAEHHLLTIRSAKSILSGQMKWISVAGSLAEIRKILF
jgi:hypothetical protein